MRITPTSTSRSWRSLVTTRTANPNGAPTTAAPSIHRTVRRSAWARSVQACPPLVNSPRDAAITTAVSGGTTSDSNGTARRAKPKPVTVCMPAATATTAATRTTSVGVTARRSGDVEGQEVVQRLAAHDQAGVAVP